MKKTLLLLLVMSSSMCSVYSQTVTKLSTVKTLAKPAKAESSNNASYKLPAALANIGAISSEDNAACNYLFPHNDINGGAYLLAPGKNTVSFIDNSSGNPSSWFWEAPGTAEGSSISQNLVAHYSNEGVFNLPSLTITTSNGTETYTPDLKIKAGGTSELTTINTREYGETYQFGTFAYGNNGGYVGGTNNVGIAGWGNLFMFNTDDAYMDGINIYLHHKPERYSDNAKVLIQVWLPSIYEDHIDFTSMPVEGEYVKMSDIKDASDDVWVPVKDGAVMSVTFDTPLDLYGKTILFVTVEGFGSDPQKEDFSILMDVTGTPLAPENMSNLLAHNSFGRIKTENSYLRPISYYGGGTGSFAICPVIRTAIESNINGVNADNDSSFNAVSENGVLHIETATAGTVRIFDTLGRNISVSEVPQGRSTLRLDTGKGVLIIQGPNGKTLKISR